MGRPKRDTTKDMNKVTKNVTKKVTKKATRKPSKKQDDEVEFICTTYAQPHPEENAPTPESEQPADCANSEEANVEEEPQKGEETEKGDETARSDQEEPEKEAQILVAEDSIMDNIRKWIDGFVIVRQHNPRVSPTNQASPLRFGDSNDFSKLQLAIFCYAGHLEFLDPR
ncbi:hypothetical protein YC2023_061495 [Brassica napus]